MKTKNNRFKSVIILLFGVLTFCKAFTVIISYKDDPTMTLALKRNPISSNIIRHYEYGKTDEYLHIISDENEVLGEPLLRSIYRIPLYAYLCVFFILIKY
ncbi:hypothetical protein D0T60_15820 [Bacteroides sp. 224]|nr:hypothetical protein [Bacteroides sp. 224]